VVEVIGQGEVAREIDFHAVTFADGHSWHDVQELVEDFCRGLRGTLRESLAHEVATAGGESAARSAFRDGSQATDRQRDPEDAEVVVVDLVPQSRIADLVEPLEPVETDGIAVGHEHAMEQDGQTHLAEGVHFSGFTQQLRS